MLFFFFLLIIPWIQLCSLDVSSLVHQKLRINKETPFNLHSYWICHRSTIHERKLERIERKVLAVHKGGLQPQVKLLSRVPEHNKFIRFRGWKGWIPHVFMIKRSFVGHFLCYRRHFFINKIKSSSLSMNLGFFRGGVEIGNQGFQVVFCKKVMGLCWWILCLLGFCLGMN
jgi:hypothetical protein